MKIFRGKADRGATAVIVALSLLVLVGFTAIAIDGGRAYNERRSTQNAADNAALAAAWAECTSTPDPAQVGRDSANTNGYASGVTVQKDGDLWVASITSTQPTEFAGVVGAGTVTVVSEARASCVVESGSGPYVLFAGATEAQCGNALSAPGSSITVNGPAHSNGSVHSPGPPIGSKVWNGPVTYGPGGSASNPLVQYKAGATLDPNAPLGYPVPSYWKVENYAPGGSRTNVANYYSYVGDQNFGSGLAPGLHYIAGDVSLQGSAYSLNDVTIVATGNIHIRGANITMTPYSSDGLALFSDHAGSPSCNTHAIQFTNATGAFEGVWFAPNGQVRINSSTVVGGIRLNGSIVAYTINIAGADRTFNYQSFTGGDPSYTVELER